MPVIVGGKEISDGAYTMFILPEARSWILIITRSTDTSGKYDQSPGDAPQHLRGVIVASVCHYDRALIGAKDCLRWDVEGQRRALQPNKAVTHRGIVWRLYSAPIISAVLSSFQRSGECAARAGGGKPQLHHARRFVAAGHYRFITPCCALVSDDVQFPDSIMGARALFRIAARTSWRLPVGNDAGFDA